LTMGQVKVRVTPPVSCGKTWAGADRGGCARPSPLSIRGRFVEQGEVHQAANKHQDHQQSIRQERPAQEASQPPGLSVSHPMRFDAPTRGTRASTESPHPERRGLAPHYVALVPARWGLTRPSEAPRTACLKPLALSRQSPRSGGRCGVKVGAGFLVAGRVGPEPGSRMERPERSEDERS
jgi:hypothetical protein